MTFETYERLRHLVDHVSTFEEFLEGIKQDPTRLTVAKWDIGDYGLFYERIKGGHHYDHIKRHE